MRIKLSRDDIQVVLTTNLQDWKKHAAIEDVQDLNDNLTPDDLINICSSLFWDDIHDESLTLPDVLDKHFMDTGLYVFGRETFISIHNIYNK